MTKSDDSDVNYKILEYIDKGLEKPEILKRFPKSRQKEVKETLQLLGFIKDQKSLIKPSKEGFKRAFDKIEISHLEKSKIKSKKAQSLFNMTLFQKFAFTMSALVVMVFAISLFMPREKNDLAKLTPQFEDNGDQEENDLNNNKTENDNSEEDKIAQEQSGIDKETMLGEEEIQSSQRELSITEEIIIENAQLKEKIESANSDELLQYLDGNNLDKVLEKSDYPVLIEADLNREISIIELN